MLRSICRRHGPNSSSEDKNVIVITKVYYLTNTDHAEDHFTMDPKEQLTAIKDMRQTA